MSSKGRGYPRSIPAWCMGTLLSYGEQPPARRERMWQKAVERARQGRRIPRGHPVRGVPAAAQQHIAAIGAEC